MQKNRWTLQEIEQLTGVPYPTLCTWQQEGVLVPVETQGRGKIRRRLFFDRRTCFACAITASLLRQGITGPGVRKTLRFLVRANLDARFAAGFRFLTLSASGQVFNNAADAIFKADGPGPVALVLIDLAQARRVFEERLAKLLGGKAPQQEEPQGDKGQKEAACQEEPSLAETPEQPEGNEAKV